MPPDFNRKPKTPSAANLLMAACLMLFLTSCGTQPGKSTQQQPAYSGTPYEQALQNAESAPLDMRSKWLLDAMEIALNDQRSDAARQAAQRLNPTLLSVREAERFSQLSKKLAELSGESAWPSEKLLSLTEQQVDRLPTPLKAEARLLRASELEKSGQLTAALITRVNVSGLLDNEEALNNHDQIWRILKEIPPLERLELQSQLKTQANPDLTQWLELAEGMQQNAQSLDAQLESLQGWLSRYPQNRASMLLPRELALLQRLPSYRPARIALLLPGEGPASTAAKALRDGFIANYLAANQAAPDAPMIDLIDTSEGSITDLMLNLQLQDYDLIIGPLQKSQVDAVAQIPALDPPVLALNYTSPPPENSGDTLSISGLYQFGLSSEDEIDQILLHLKERNLTRVLVLASTESWSQRLTDYLEVEASVFNITLIGQNDPIEVTAVSDSIAYVLDVDQSRQRARELQYLIGKVDFQPRRRQDVEAVLVITSPSIARQLKPLLAFHYASDLPVYATSQIYSGKEDPANDRDLNGIIMVETPWTLSRTLELKQQAKQFYPATLTSFFAMGADTYHLASRLALMKSFPGSLYQGQTGDLRMNDRQQIRRRLEWATFQEGRLVPLPSLTIEAAPEAPL